MSCVNCGKRDIFKKAGEGGYEPEVDVGGGNRVSPRESDTLSPLA